MKTLRKVSFDNFDRMSITEAAQLYGGTGGNPPTTPVPTDSIGKGSTDPVPPTKKKIKQTVSGGIKQEANKSQTVTGSYEITTKGGLTIGATGGYNTKTGFSGGVTVKYSW